jgi:hypothetical protein
MTFGHVLESGMVEQQFKPSRPIFLAYMPVPVDTELNSSNSH